MKTVLFSAPHKHIKHVLDEYKEVFSYTDSPGVAEYWVPDPNANYTIGLDVLHQMPRLTHIATPSTGMNHINLLSCQMRNVKVLSLLDDRKGLDEIKASSEFTFLLILLALRHGAFRMFQDYMRNDDMMRGGELFGRTVGLVGYGRIGKNLAHYLQAFGCKWYYHDPLYKPEDALGHMFEQDITVICCALNEDTEGMITKKQLDLKPPGSILVNTARAEIIKKTDLESWAKKGLHTYAADVLHGEVTGNHVKSPLLKLTNCIITPHIAGTTYESQEKAARIVLELLRNECLI